MLKYILFLGILISIGKICDAQEALPDFSVKKGVQNHVIISWRNNFGDNISILNIQRSADGIRNFRTIYSCPNASLAINAYTDIHPAPGELYYRIYYTTKNGNYVFTDAKKIASGYVSDGLLSKLDSTKDIAIQGDETGKLHINQLRRLKDSVLYNTSDSLFFIDTHSVLYKKFNSIAAVIQAPTNTLTQVSNYLFQNTDGNVVIRLPQNNLDAFSMIIYQPNGHTVFFKINHFDNSEIILNKSSFLHAGWYPYELFENGKLKERNKFEVK